MDKFIFQIPRGIKRSVSVSKECKEDATTNSSSKKKKLQMFLDLGQKGFGKSNQCRHCSLVYLIGDDEDEKEHNKYCKEMKSGIPFTSVGKYCALANLPNGNKIVSVPVRALSNDKCLANMAKNMHDDFGFDVSTLDSLSEDACIGVFVYVSNGFVVGCIVHEHVARRSIVRLNRGSRVSDLDVKSISAPASVIEVKLDIERKTISSDPDYVLGVRYLWVQSQHRRIGVGCALMDATRKSAVFGTIVPKSELAFSQPTEAGISFAFAYAGNPATDHILVYS
jgi:N-acetyltransferase